MFINEILKPMEKIDYDFFHFLPERGWGKFRVEAGQFPGNLESDGGNEIGDKYYIIIFKYDYGSKKLSEIDNFEAILSCPLTYASGIMEMGWFGVICRKCGETSVKFMDDILDLINKGKIVKIGFK